MLHTAEVNAKDLVAGGALWELVRISRECSREDIRNLAQRTLNASGTFQSELRRLHLVYWVDYLHTKPQEFLSSELEGSVNL
jgi:hypothetical protein